MLIIGLLCDDVTKAGRGKRKGVRKKDEGVRNRRHMLPRPTSANGRPDYSVIYRHTDCTL